MRIYVRHDAIAWQPFIKHVLNFLLSQQPTIKLILLGKIANVISKLIDLKAVHSLSAEHPYNLSFIGNPDVLAFFQPLHLLLK